MTFSVAPLLSSDPKLFMRPSLCREFAQRNRWFGWGFAPAPSAAAGLCRSRGRPDSRNSWSSTVVRCGYGSRRGRGIRGCPSSLSCRRRPWIGRWTRRRRRQRRRGGRDDGERTRKSPPVKAAIPRRLLFMSRGCCSFCSKERPVPVGLSEPSSRDWFTPCFEGTHTQYHT